MFHYSLKYPCAVLLSVFTCQPYTSFLLQQFLSWITPTPTANNNNSNNKMYFLSVSKSIQRKKQSQKIQNRSTGIHVPVNIANCCNTYSGAEASFLPSSLGKKEMNAAVVGQGITVDLEWTSQKCPKQINSIETSAAVLLEFHIKT